MCTSLAYKSNNFYFCRNMDLDYHFGEEVVITPRNYCLDFKHEKSITSHYAIIGMATIRDGYPLYAEGANEMGLCISALNFPGNTHYLSEPVYEALNLAPYEIIPYVLSTCKTVGDAENMLQKLKIINTPFSASVGTSELHWHIADKNESITLESTDSGVKIYKNPIGILTNNPPFPFHVQNLNQYLHLSPAVPLKSNAGHGAGAIGLPGDYSSISRFVRLNYLNTTSTRNEDELADVATAFRLMYSAAPIKGTVLTGEGKEHYTTYTCIINATKGIYRYTTSENLDIKLVNLFNNDINADGLISSPII